MAALALCPTVRLSSVSRPLRSLRLMPAFPMRIERGAEGIHRKLPASNLIKAVTAGVVGGAGGNQGFDTNEEIKVALYQAVQGINRGIFGVTSSRKSEILELMELLESRNPTPQPTDKIKDKVDGCWKLLYSTITILGAKRTKLGLRYFISLGDFLQTIDASKEKAYNMIKFNVRGMKKFNGQLTIEASYKITSKTRVEIKLETSTITPDQVRPSTTEQQHRRWLAGHNVS